MQCVTTACPFGDGCTLSPVRRGDARKAAWFHPATSRTADARPSGGGGADVCHSHGPGPDSTPGQLWDVQTGVAPLEYPVPGPAHGAEPEPGLLHPARAGEAGGLGVARSLAHYGDGG